MIRYDISPLDPEAHLFIVGITIPNPCANEQLLRMPNWISGSYMIRDFAAHVQSEEAYLGDTPAAITKVDKCTWRISTVGRKDNEDLYIFYQVWAFDASVRMAYLDDCRGFFNPGSVFMQPLGLADGKLQVNINAPVDEMHADTIEWKVATSLTRAKGTARFGWGLYEARNYDELIDCPVEIGDFEVLTFKAHGTRHDVIFSDVPVNFDSDRVTADLRTICETEIEFWDPAGKKAPMSEYVFLVNVTANQFGGLEHRRSTALFTPRRTLPSTHDTVRTKDYIDFLMLVSHEYFHTWNVKRITPCEFVGTDFCHETPTRLLWFFEGFTSYYDDLLLRRAALIDNERYAGLLTVDFKAVLESNAHNVQSLGQASFDAWIKFYKPTANTPNACVSYYKQGALAALCLDAQIRTLTQGEKSLDDVMRAVWADYTSAGRKYGGLTEQRLVELINGAAGTDLSETVHRLVNTTQCPDYAAVLVPLGAELISTPRPAVRSILGIDGSGSEAGYTVKTVFDHEPAQWVGIAPGDILIAVDGVRIRNDNLEQLLSRYAEGDQMLVHAFRDDAMMAWAMLIGRSQTVHSTVSIKAPSALGLQWLNG